MKQRENSFLEGPILPSLLKFAIPVLLALLLQALYGAVDLWAVGRFATTADISAVSTGSQTMQIVTGIVTGLSMGTTVLLGQHIGQKDDDGAARIIGTSIKLFCFLGIILSIVMLLAARPIATWMNAPEEAFLKTLHYIQICGGGSLCIVAYNLLCAIFLIKIPYACFASKKPVPRLFDIGLSTAYAALFTLLICLIFYFYLHRRKVHPHEGNAKH